MPKAEMTGGAVDAAALPADARSFMDEPAPATTRKLVLVKRDGTARVLDSGRPLPPEPERERKRYPPPAFLVVICRCGAPYKMMHGGHSTLGQHACVPVPAGTPRPARGTRSARGAEPAAKAETTRNDEQAPQPPHEKSLPAPEPARRRGMVRSTGGGPAEPTGEPERTAEAETWLS